MREECKCYRTLSFLFFVFFAVVGNPEKVKGTKSSKRQFGLPCLEKDKELIRLRHKEHQNYYQERVTSF